MKTEIIKTLAQYPEVSALYGDIFAKSADLSEEDAFEAVKLLRIPQEWRAFLPAEHDVFYNFGFMPAEFWVILLKARKDIADAARCFESGRVALICAGLESEDEIEFMKSNFNDSICASFHWVDILNYQPKYEDIAEKCNAWKTIMSGCPFAVAGLLRKRPEYAVKLAPYEFWKFFEEDDWELLKKEQPELLKYKK